MINWSTLIADPITGSIDYARVRSLASIFLAIVAGVMAVTVVYIVRDIDTGLVSIAVGALVLPLTGGKIADGLSGRSKSASIQSGSAPGRRSSDSTPKPDA